MDEEKLFGYTAKEWMLAMLDILDGSATRHEIHSNTGLSEERSKELSSMFYSATKDGWPTKEESTK